MKSKHLYNEITCVCWRAKCLKEHEWRHSACWWADDDGDDDGTTKTSENFRTNTSTAATATTDATVAVAPAKSDINIVWRPTLGRRTCCCCYCSLLRIFSFALGWKTTKIQKYTMIYANNHVFFLLIFSRNLLVFVIWPKCCCKLHHSKEIAKWSESRKKDKKRNQTKKDEQRSKNQQECRWGQI